MGGDGRLYATNPESGFFGVAAGTSQFNNLALMVTMKKGNNIFLNTALTPDGDVWWEVSFTLAPTKEYSWKAFNW